jgi:CBS domain-containing protein
MPQQRIASNLLRVAPLDNRGVLIMNIADLCRREAVTVRPSDEVLTAARLMRESHVGYLAVIDQVQPGEHPRPVGVLTDRDIVVAVVAPAVDPARVSVGDIMTRTPVMASGTDSPEQAARAMRRAGVRRLPVVGQQGELIGVVSLDDVLEYLAGALQSIAGAIRHEQQVERQLRL